MDLLDRLAEQHIQQAIDDGELDNLPGQGRPLQLDDNRQVPESLRAGYRLLKNAGFLPPEIALRRDIESAETLLRHAEPESETARQADRRLQWLELRLAESLQARQLSLDPRYADQVRQRLGGRQHKPD